MGINIEGFVCEKRIVDPIEQNESFSQENNALRLSWKMGFLSERRGDMAAF